MDRDAFISRVRSLVAHATEGPGGSWAVNENGEAVIVEQFDAGNKDAHEVANLLMGMIADGANVATPEWEAGW